MKGEICIGGSGIFQGYYNQKKLMDSKLVNIGGIKYFRTGDGGRIDDTGLLFCYGRTDNQKKFSTLLIIQEMQVESTLYTC